MFGLTPAKILSPLMRLTALLCSVALLTGGALILEGRNAASTITASAETAEELRDRRDEILERQAELEALRAQSAASLEEYESQKAIIKEQIDLKIEEIQIIDDLIAPYAQEIALRQNELDRRQAELDVRFAELQERLRALSKTSALTTTLQMLISVNSFSDYLIKTKAMEILSAETEALMQTLEAEMKQLNEEKAIFEEASRPYYEAKAQLDTAKLQLESLYSELNTVTEKLHSDIDRYNQDIEQAQNEADAIEDQIDQIIRDSVNTGQTFLSGSMYWPAEDCNYISSTFKYRWGRWHRGLDICGSGCYGSPINAAEDGIVTYAGWMGGYGYCVMIDHGADKHGRNITTVYAHASELYVSKGQTVYAKQRIAAIGATGNVTGPHLHFEVRVNGTAVDPLANGYLSTTGIIVDESL